ncbi:major capsid protein [Microbulbifer sp. OS29]|uniref:Major capsid protein n=1 Tax=Microbulbifer okhotskensis TaxID=2926617 RepID=A0A9X2EPQ6_9GAMM|nr:major capsid protein [Microbulbifer okhotskensis]MCO1336122.1 major capsid protein [Microbulbifer okhotskensis]
MKQKLLGLLFIVAAVIAPSALAQTTAIDTTDVLAQLGLIAAAVAAVGGAMAVAAGVAVGFKWLKGAIFG